MKYTRNTKKFLASGAILLATGLAFSQTPTTIAPAKLPRVGTVDERYQSYNIEMLEVTGGRFWAPYKQASSGPAAAADTTAPTPGGMPASLYRYRAPIDLTNPRLRKLAAALGPAYVRVSGTWANSTFFQDSDEPAPANPPAGFGGVLTRKEWQGVIDFSHAVDAGIVTSFAISPGVRDSAGVWTPVEAKKFLAFTRSAGGGIAAAELFNEPTFASMGGAPKGYDAAAYARDFQAFHAYISTAGPEIKVLGPGSVGEAGALGPIPGVSLLHSEDMLAAEGPGLDAFSYHFYGGVSKRCAMMGAASQASPETALSAAWLGKTEHDEEFYAAMRDKFTPGKPIWLTETGETACGGNPWASTFVDSFRYLNQLGALAKRGVQVTMHNTLAASDYALIDEATLIPRPNYWSAVLWRRLMGTTVLDAGPSPSPDLHLYAHCQRNIRGGVTLLAINADKTNPYELSLPAKSGRFTLTAASLTDSSVELNGSELKLTADGNLPPIPEKITPKGKIALAPASITFLTIPGAGNENCR